MVSFWQFSVKVGAAVTMNAAEHVWVEQSLVAVKVTVAVPPVQAFGAAGALLVNTVLQPPVVVTPANHAA